MMNDSHQLAHQLTLAFLIALGMAGGVTVSEESSVESRHAASKQNKSNPVAKSHAQLAQLVFTAIDTKNYTAIRRLMVPVALLTEIGTPRNKLEAHVKYTKRLTHIAKKYRHYLNKRGLLPLKARAFEKHQPLHAHPQTMNDRSVEFSTGIRLVNKDGTILFEIIDQAIAIDGRWYLIRLCTESVEAELPKKQLTKGRDADDRDSRNRKD